MNEPTFLTVELAIAVHANQMALYGGMPGIRDRGGLESAIAQAESSFAGAYLHATVFEQAACYLFHITKNHPFLDGNKRAGTACALVFLYMNGYSLDPRCDDGDLYHLTIGVAEGRTSKQEVADFFTLNV